MSELVYEASIYKREVKYRNYKGETKTVTLQFSLDPLALLSVIAGFNPKKVKSGNPSRQGQVDLDEGEQVKFIQDLAARAAGTPTDDGESWTPFEDFTNDLAGQAFLTRLVTSDGDRKEFAEKVILDPFRAFVNFTKDDPSNTPKDIQQFEKMLQQLESIFVDQPNDETLEDRKARLAAELAAMEEG